MLVMAAEADGMSDFLQLGDRTFSSRLLLGTGKFSGREAMLAAIRASGTELVTVACAASIPITTTTSAPRSRASPASRSFPTHHSAHS